jgi:hypothetical protein
MVGGRQLLSSAKPLIYLEKYAKQCREKPVGVRFEVFFRPGTFCGLPQRGLLDAGIMMTSKGTIAG